MTVKIERLGHILGLAEHFATIKIILILLSIYDIYYIYSMIDYARYINIYDYILYTFILSIVDEEFNILLISSIIFLYVKILNLISSIISDAYSLQLSFIFIF